MAAPVLILVALIALVLGVSSSQVLARLFDPRWKVEIEVEAVLP